MKSSGEKSFKIVNHMNNSKTVVCKNLKED